MSLELRHNSTKETLPLSWREYYTALDVAQRYGWQPQGTKPFCDEMYPDWDGNYEGCDYQTITAADGQNLASALREAADATKDDVNALLTPKSMRVIADFFAADAVSTIG